MDMLSRVRVIVNRKTFENCQRTQAYQVSNTHFSESEKKGVMIHMAMVKDVQYGKTMRKSYAKYEEILEIPNMLKIQKDSYQWFLEEGLREVFKDVGTITDFSGKLELSFLDYSMNEPPKYTIEECRSGTQPMPGPSRFGSACATPRPMRSRNRTSSWAISP